MKDLRPPARFDREKRRAVRRKVKVDAAIRFPDGQAAACEVRDISQTGARLKLVVAEPVPEMFILDIPGNARITRRCRLVSQDGVRVGCRFADV